MHKPNTRFSSTGKFESMSKAKNLSESSKVVMKRKPYQIGGKVHECNNGTSSGKD